MAATCTLLQITVFVLLEYILYASAGFPCFEVCTCERPKVICNLTDQSFLPTFYHRSYYTVLDIYGSPKLSEILDGNFRASWQLEELSIINTNISAVPCTALNGLSGTNTFRLIGNPFKEVPQCALGEFPGTMYLYINRCLIESLNNDDFSKLTNLRVLDLSWNAISDINILAFTLNSKLKRLILRGNRLRALKSQQFQSLGTPYLDMLDLSYNEIETISSDSFSGIASRMFGLDLSYNKITQTTWSSVMNVLSSFPRLETVNVSGNPLEHINHNANLFARLTTFEAAGCFLSTLNVTKFDHIRSVNVSNNGLTIRKITLDRKESVCDPGVTQKSDEPKCPNVSRDVSRNEISSLEVVVNYTSRIQNISVHAAKSGIKQASIRVIKDSNSDNIWEFIVFKLCGNEITDQIDVFIDRSTNTSDIAVNLTLDLSSNKIRNGLESSIKIHLNDFENPGLYDALDVCSFRNSSVLITELDLSGNGILEIPTSSCLVSQVEILKLNGNDVGRIEKFSLRKTFSEHNRTRIIELRRNRITTIASDAFDDLPYLETIDLRDNMLKMFPEMPYLKSLDSFRMLAVDGNPLMCDCGLAWISSYTVFFNAAQRVTGRCSTPASAKGFSLLCYTWGQSECFTSPISTTERYTLAQTCEGDHFVYIADLKMSVDESNPSNVRIEWLKAGPALLYGYRISYTSPSTTLQELFVPSTESFATLYSLTGGESYKVCLTPVITDAIVKTGESFCGEITPGSPVSFVVVGLSVALGIVAIILVVISAIFIIHMLKNHRTGSNTPKDRPAYDKPGQLGTPDYDDIAGGQDIYHTAP